MALTTPILNSVAAWDVNNGQTFTFNVIGGDLVNGNKLTIRNSNNQVVYTQETTTFQYKVVVPPNPSGLSNGQLYNAYVQTKNNNEYSANSNVIQFYCFATPTWTINNISSGQIIHQSYVIPNAHYSQSNGEALGDYNFILYDSAQNVLSQTGTIYTGFSNTLGQQFVADTTYRFQGLEDGDSYFIQVTGHTTGGTYIETSLVSFSVQYSTPEEYNLIYLQNNCKDGYITYSSMAYSIKGVSNPTPPIYTTNGVNLTQVNHYVSWNSGYEISNDFTVKAWVQSPNDNTTLFILSNGENDHIEVNYMEDPLDNTKRIAVIQLYFNGQYGYFVYSNSFIPPTDSQTLCIQARRINNLYDIVAEVIE